MAEYTYDDIIMNPNDPRLEGAIGKECYFSDYPKKLLNSAIYNLPEYLDCLTDIRKEGTCTFVDKNGTKWALIIIKKEEPKPKPKYIPFENVTEFLDAYRSVANWLGDQDLYLLNHGIWLKAKDADDALFMVTDIWSYGVVFSCNMKTTEELEGEYLTINEPTTWEQLLMLYTFIDDSPCGKEVEDQ